MTRSGKRTSARSAAKRGLFAGRKRISARAADRVEIAASRRWLVGGVLLLAYVAVSDERSDGRAKKCYDLSEAGLSALQKSRDMYDSLWAGVSLKADASKS